MSEGGAGVDLIYLMHATTTPLDPRVREAMAPLLNEEPGRPGSLLASVRRPGELIEAARGEVARMAGLPPDGIIFTSGGTEACNLALKGVALARLTKSGARGRILVAATEHSAVLYPARTLAKLGFEAVEIPVTSDGLIDLDALALGLEGGALLVSVALATPETGTIQPLGEVARLAHARGALVHTDGCLAAAGIPPGAGLSDVDLASFSAHKIGGPRGAGALWIRAGVRVLPLLEGGTNEGGRRGGAEYVAGIAGFGVAARLLAGEIAGEAARLSRLTSRLEEGILGVPGVSRNGHPALRHPGILNVSVAGVDGEALQLRLASRGIAVSSGSSCFQEAGKPSHVLLAMGVPPDLAQGSLCFSLGRRTTEDEIDRVKEVFPRVVASLRALSVKA